MASLFAAPACWGTLEQLPTAHACPPHASEASYGAAHMPPRRVMSAEGCAYSSGHCPQPPHSTSRHPHRHLPHHTASEHPPKHLGQHPSVGGSLRRKHTRSRLSRICCKALPIPLEIPHIPPIDQLFALDCLSTGLTMDHSTGLPVDTTLLQVKAGGLSCGGSSAVTPLGMGLAASLVVLHVALFLGPLLATFWLRGLSRDYPEQTAVQAPGWVLASMAVFSVGTLGEIGAHVHDQWIYVNLVPTLFGALFYGGLAAGQAVLAVGVAGPSMSSSENAINAFSVFLILASLYLATDALSSTGGGPLSLSLAAITSSVARPQFQAAPDDFRVTWALVSTALMVTSTSFVRACFRSGGEVRHEMYLGLLIVFYGVGTLCSVQIPITGSQFWHVPTAAASLSGFVVQLVWIRNMMRASDRVARGLSVGAVPAQPCTAATGFVAELGEAKVDCRRGAGETGALGSFQKFLESAWTYMASSRGVGELQRGTEGGEKRIEASGTVSGVGRLR